MWSIAAPFIFLSGQAGCQVCDCVNSAALICQRLLCKPYIYKSYSGTWKPLLMLQSSVDGDTHPDAQREKESEGEKKRGSGWTSWTYAALCITTCQRRTKMPSKYSVWRCAATVVIRSCWCVRWALIQRFVGGWWGAGAGDSAAERKGCPDHWKRGARRMNAAPRYSPLGGKMRKLFPRLCGGGEQRRDPQRSTPTQRGTHTLTPTHTRSESITWQKGHPA